MTSASNVQKRMLYAGCATSICAYVVATFQASYFGRSYLPALSFWPDDGWCKKPEESIGVHCFGDFALWDDVVGSTSDLSPYAIPSGIIQLWFHNLGDLFGSYRVALVMYLCLSAFSLMVPLVWMLRKSPVGVTSLLFLGPAITPFLVAFDRGNSIVFAVPSIFLLAKAFFEDRSRMMLLWFVVLAVIKPHFAIFGLLFLHKRRFRELAVSCLIVVAAYLSVWAAAPGGLLEFARKQVSFMSSYDSYQPLSAAWPLNISVARSVFMLLNLADFGFFKNPEILARQVALLVIVGLAVWILVLSIRKDVTNRTTIKLPLCLSIFVSVAPSISFFYYTALVVPVIASYLHYSGLLEANEQRIRTQPHDAHPSSTMMWLGLGLFLVTTLYPIPVFVSQLLPDPPHWLVGPNEVIFLQVFSGWALLLILFALAIDDFQARRKEGDEKSKMLERI